MNGSTEVAKNQEVQILNLTTELSFLKLQLTKFQQTLHEEQAKYLQDQKAADHKRQQLESEIDEHRSKNDQLRQKNWKLVEALKAAESRNATECHKSTQVEVSCLNCWVFAVERCLFSSRKNTRTMRQKWSN